MGADQPVADEETRRLLKQAASELGARAWIVGGYVRDSLLGRPHPNLDVVVEGGLGLELARRFAQLAGAGEPVIFERFGTAQVTLPGHLVEFVSARRESYAPDSRKPMTEDATLDDDTLRMLRAIRFAAQLGFDLAPELPLAMRKMRDRVGPPALSVERVADELRKMLISGQPQLALELLVESGLLEVLLPEVAACKGVQQGGYHTHDVFGHTLLAVAAAPSDLLVRLGALFHDIGKPATAAGDGTFMGHDVVGAEIATRVLERLRFPQKEIEDVAQLVRLHLRPVFYSSEWTDGAVRRLARDAGELLEPLMALARADIAASAYPYPQKMDELQARLDAVLAEHPSRMAAPVDGDDIMRVRRIGPGPEVGRIKQRLTELVMDGALEPTREAVLSYLESHSDL